MRRVIVILTVVCARLLIGALPGGALAQTPVADLAWEPCPAPFPVSATPVVDPADFPPGLECATVTVPLDYADPGGEQIAIGLNRLPALDADKRIGSLIVNPGGPGGSATEIVAVAALGLPIFSPAIREHFDLIGMDPRGVGASTPVRCDPELWNKEISLFPEDEAAFQALEAHYRAFGESCLRLTGPLLEHVDTESAARDIEAVRVALNDGPLNFLGLSYGSQLGATYAEVFPQHIRVMALDGALDHATSGLAMLADESRAYEAAFNRFAQWCAEAEECALYGQDVGAYFDRLVSRADREPIPAPGCVAEGYCEPTVSGEEIRLSAQEQLLSRDDVAVLGIGGWAGLATALAEAEAGDASRLSPTLAVGEDDRHFAALAIECADWPTEIESFEDIEAAQLLGRVISPHTQGASQTWTILTGCIGWPVPVANPPRPVEVEGAPPILIVNSTHDPSTAYVWAPRLREQIEGSVLLTREGDGHTSYLQDGESETRDAIDTYLITGATPPPNTVFRT